jgi:plasmid stability protein
MTALTLKNIPQPLYLALKSAAQREHRSLHAQAIYCLERVLSGSDARTPSGNRLDRLRALRPVMDPLTEEDIQDALNQGRL